MPRTAPTISLANRILSTGITVRQQIDARLVIHARVEEDVVKQMIPQQRLFISCASPRKRPQWYGTAPPPCGMTKRSVGKSLNRSAEALHERGRVGVQVVRAGGVEARIAAGADMDHGGDVVLDHLLVNRVPVAVRQGRAESIGRRTGRGSG